MKLLSSFQLATPASIEMVQLQIFVSVAQRHELGLRLN